MVRLKEKYKNEVIPSLKEQLGIGNIMRVPKVTKVVVNMGVGAERRDSIKELTKDLSKLTGQLPLVTRARLSISNFKLREEMEIGAKVTLRGDRMYEFLDRLINVTLPRIRDFRGISVKSFDGRGNYTFGLKEQSIFAEIDPNDVTTTQGMDVTIVTTGQSDKEAHLLLKAMGVPFEEKK
jgi:large subunit ribosomal protein L5